VRCTCEQAVREAVKPLQEEIEKLRSTYLKDLEVASKIIARREETISELRSTVYRLRMQIENS
jgi:archaellum component FlaC